MDNVAGIMLLGGTVVFIFLTGVKTYFFYKSTQRPTLKRWFYFSYVDIEGSKVEATKKRKRRQNYFSLALLLFVVFFLTAFYVVRNR